VSTWLFDAKLVDELLVNGADLGGGAAPPHPSPPSLAGTVTSEKTSEGQEIGVIGFLVGVEKWTAGEWSTIRNIRIEHVELEVMVESQHRAPCPRLGRRSREVANIGEQVPQAAVQHTSPMLPSGGPPGGPTTSPMRQKLASESPMRPSGRPPPCS